MDSDDDYHDIDKFDRNKKKEKFDSDESDKDAKERERMQRRLKNKQNKKKDDVDINAFISGGTEQPEESKTEKKGKKEKKEKKKKMTKQEKKEAKKAKQKAKAKGEDEEDKEQEEEKTQAEEEDKVQEEEKEEKPKKKKKPKFPLKLHYCTSWGVPPEYCTFLSKDLEACKKDLEEKAPALYQKIYLDREDEVAEESKGKKKKIKTMKKTNEITKSTQFKVVKYKRGGKKMVTEIYGLDGYGLNLKDLAKKLGKKFACGNSMIKSEDTGESIVQFLGDIDEDAFMIAVSNDFPDLAVAKFKFESGGNKKGRKKK